MSDAFRHCMDLLRTGDREFYLAVLFAPEDKRPALAALHAFNLETARIRDLVSEPMPGEIRLQWWREVVEGSRDGEARQNPVAGELIAAIEAFNLSRAALTNLLDARVFDLYDDPMPDRVTLEGYLGETVSALFQMSAQVLADGADPHTADAAGHGGVAHGIVSILRRMPLDRGRRRVMIPSDILAAAGIDPAGWVAGSDAAAMARAVAILIDIGREHLGKAEAAISAADKALRPAFLPLSECAPAFARATKPSAAPWARPIYSSPVASYMRVVTRAIRS
ncbi:phytoene/squalene synthase family protein [Oricola sp.]|uniref:phytoene/squalene synthase family protein n=1 Tax=Oricola sp. TaxID=1979950 RepID=UPI003516FA4A